MKLWEGLEQDFNYNAMVSQRGVLNLCHTDAQRDAFRRRGNAMRLNGVDAELLDTERRAQDGALPELRQRPLPDQGRPACSRAAARCAMTRWPGAMRAAPTAAASTSSRTAKSPAFASRTANASGVETTRGFIGANKVGVAVAGSSGRVMAMAGMRLPIESHVLQAFVTEGLKPVIPGVITFGAGHFYVSQSDKGGLVFGGDIDGYNSYAQRGNLPVVEDVCEGGMA